ncbi:MAG: hypothetical protein AB1634_05710 [Thermodesulfobacteriota bacterium]
MKIRGMVVAGLLASALAAPGIVSAATVSLYGDKDGFGRGILPDQGFDWSSISQSPVGEGLTDYWVLYSQSWHQTYALPGTITGASIEIMAGGLGLPVPATLSINGTVIGTLTDGDNTGPAYNYARLDTFDLMPFLGALTGNDLITVSTGADGWVLDYSEIVLNRATVPVPASLALLAPGLAGLGLLRRRWSR